MSYLWTKRETPGLRWTPLPNKPVTGWDLAPHVDQQRNGYVGDVTGELSSDGDNVDAAAAALVDVDVVGAGAGADDDAEIRERPDDVSGDRLVRVAEDGSDGGRVGLLGFEESEEWELRGEGFEETVFVRVL